MVGMFTIRHKKLVRQVLTPVRVVNPVTMEEEETLALWDTGSTSTCISNTIAYKLRMRKKAEMISLGVHGDNLVGVYSAEIKIGKNISIPIDVTNFGNMSNEIGVIIGMDIITMGDFALSNADGHTVMTFRIPSQGEINFVQEYNEKTMK